MRLETSPKKVTTAKDGKTSNRGKRKKEKKTTSGDIVTETEKEGRRKHLFLHWDDDDDR